MPIVRGFDNEGCFYRYGEMGTKYHYSCGNELARQRAYDKAREQEIAIISSGYSEGLIKLTTLKKWRSTADSSNVDKVMYNGEISELVVKFNSGEIYTYYGVDFTTFLNIVNGEAVCITEGENRYGKWWVGKSPSVGAAVYQYLVDNNISYKKGGSLR